MGSDVCNSLSSRVTLRIFQSTLPAWGATSDYPEKSRQSEFQSTLPAWGATLRRRSRGTKHNTISIHAPRMGSDQHEWQFVQLHKYFNPRSPHGERQQSWMLKVPNVRGRFQSTLPAWGATEIFICYRNTGDISIHAPRMGSDARKFALH